MNVSRRRFCYSVAAGASVAAAGVILSRKINPNSLPLKRPVVDFHVHLFAAGDAQGLADDERSYLSPTQRRHWTYSFLMRLLKIRPNQPLDEAYVEQLVTHLRASSIDRAVLLAQDGRYDEQGRLDLSQTTSIYIPNRYLFRVVRKHPDLFVSCPSINPK